MASYPVNILEYKRNVKNSPIELSVHDITKTSLSYDVVNNTDYSSIETGTRYFILRKGLLGYKQFYDGASFNEIAIIIDKTQTLSIDWTDSIGELKAGKYLLVKEFSPLKYGVRTGETYKVYAEFEIASEPIEV